MRKRNMDNRLVKQDIGFLEYPLWFQDERMAEQNAEGYVWQDREGYVYRAGYKPPAKADRLFLLYLTLKSQNEGWNEQIELTRFEILTACRISPNTHWYQRLEDSLERWKMVGIKFQGTFYDGKDYCSINFGIIDSWKIEKETKKLQIRFSPEWLLQQKNSNFYKLIDFNEVTVLRSPLTVRLYEILVKTFQGRSKWEIDAVKLALKIPMDKQYPAHIIPKITAAVNRINKQTSLQLSLEVRRPRRGKAIFVFHKLTPKVENEAPKAPRVLDVAEESQESLEALLALLRAKERGKKTIIGMVSRALRKHDEEYVKRNILYANQFCTKNYRAYLGMALKKDWAEGWEEDLEVKTSPSAQDEEQEQVKLKEPTEEEVEERVQEHLAQMSSSEWEWRTELAKKELAKEEGSHPDKISEEAAKSRALQGLSQEFARILSSSAS